MTTARSWHSATLLLDGRDLTAENRSQGHRLIPMKSAETFAAESITGLDRHMSDLTSVLGQEHGLLLDYGVTVNYLFSNFGLAQSRGPQRSQLPVIADHASAIQPTYLQLRG